MKTCRFISCAVLALWVGAAPVWAQDLQSRIIAQLQTQGFERIEITRTWLGRVRIDAEGPGMEREIVFNPNTGEILRDYWESEGSGRSGLFAPGDEEDHEEDGDDDDGNDGGDDSDDDDDEEDNDSDDDDDDGGDDDDGDDGDDDDDD